MFCTLNHHRQELGHKRGPAESISTKSNSSELEERVGQTGPISSPDKRGNRTSGVLVRQLSGNPTYRARKLNRWTNFFPVARHLSAIAFHGFFSAGGCTISKSASPWW